VHLPANEVELLQLCYNSQFEPTEELIDDTMKVSPGGQAPHPKCSRGGG
jgi:hypothetical protein